ncbi:MAG: TIGR00341 family protein [Patescibacteria group bacterium]
MFKQLFMNISEKEKTEAVENLFGHSAPNTNFFLMVTLSVLMATLGLLANNSAVIVGSMLIAPILYPILGLSMGIIMSDHTLVFKSFMTMAKAVVLCVIVAAGTTLLFSSQLEELTFEIFARTEPSLLSMAIGIVAGLAAAFALVKPKMSETLPGVAISVALVPPIAVVGIGLATFDMSVMMGALLLFLVNIIGVVIAAAVVFSMMNFYVKREIAKAVVQKEEKEIFKEAEKVKEKII